MLKAPDPLVTDTRGVAVALGIGTTKARQIIKSGELPSIRIGTRVLVPVNALAAYVAARSGEVAA